MPDYIGDGYCDDGNNKLECNFDQGDCCGHKVNKDYCKECTCYENPTGKKIVEDEK